MRTHNRTFQFAALAMLLLALCGRATAQEPLPNAEPVNVEGKWTISAKNPDGTVDTKYVELKQTGNQITGHFKGPNQSGGLQGTVTVTTSSSAPKPGNPSASAAWSTATPSKAPFTLAVA